MALPDVITYRMEAHLFVATSPPACTTYGLQELCKKTKTNNIAKAFIREDFYVDDDLLSWTDSNSALSLVRIDNILRLERLRFFSGDTPSRALEAGGMVGMGIHVVICHIHVAYHM